MRRHAWGSSVPAKIVISRGFDGKPSNGVIGFDFLNLRSIFDRTLVARSDPGYIQ
jgi:hypothetical protein